MNLFKRKNKNLIIQIYNKIDDNVFFRKPVTDNINYFKKFKKVLITVNSKVNNITSANTILKSIEILKNKLNIEFIGFIEDYCYGSNYLILTKCDKIYGHKSSLIGNFNFNINYIDISNFISKYNIQINQISSNNNAINIPKLLTNNNDSNNIINDHITYLNNSFKNNILNNRKILTNDTYDYLINNSKINGVSALNNNFIDGFSSVEEFIKSSDKQTEQFMYEKISYYNIIMPYIIKKKIQNKINLSDL